jgi:thiol:disulfide interchange protein DsbC
MKSATRTLLTTAALMASCGLHALEAPTAKSPAKPASALSQAIAPEVTIRKVLAARWPDLPMIDEVTKTPVPGLYEVRYGGTEILYIDPTGEYVLHGSLIETKTKTDLTEARIEKLLAIDFDKLPIKDAVLIKQGTGARKMAVFVDPNCGYCKRFERDLAAVKDVTVYTFLIPILGPDSTIKSRDIWCSKDATTTWRAWMLDGVAPGKADAKCDTAAIERNLAFAQKYKINGTPAVLFADGTRKPGAIPGAMVEKLLVAAAASAKKP